MKAVPLICAALAFLFSSDSARKVIDRKCLKGDCLSLVVESGKVFGNQTWSGPKTPWIEPGTIEVGRYEPKGTRFVPATEAPIRYSSTKDGWLAVVSAFVPVDFGLWPNLRLRIVHSPETVAAVRDLDEVLLDFQMGELFADGNELLMVATQGEHAYDVETLVWFLPPDGSAPSLLLNAPGTPGRVQRAAAGQKPGLWINCETYNGVDAKTKGFKPEFWTWDKEAHRLAVNEARLE